MKEFKVIINKKHIKSGTLPVIDNGLHTVKTNKPYLARIDNEGTLFQIWYRLSWRIADPNDFQMHVPRVKPKPKLIVLKTKTFCRTVMFEIIQYMEDINFPADNYTIIIKNRYYYVCFNTINRRVLGVARRKKKDIVFEIPVDSEIYNLEKCVNEI